MLAEFWRYDTGDIVHTAEIQVMDLEQQINSTHDNKQLWIYEVKAYEGIHFSVVWMK